MKLTKKMSKDYLKTQIIKDKAIRMGLSWESLYWFFVIYFSEYIKYLTAAFTNDAPDVVNNWYKDKSKSIGWEIWKEYDEEGGFIANYKDFRLVLTVVYIEDNYYPDTRITINIR